MGMAAGAIIAGAVFGDKMSPLSDTTNLAALVTKVNIFLISINDVDNDTCFNY